MEISNTEHELRHLIARNGYAEHSNSEHEPPAGLALVELVIDWYAARRVEAVVLDADGDMLLFQWGTFDWGGGPTFQVDITRQFMQEPDEIDGASMWQLSTCLHYPANADTAAVRSGSRWCSSPAELESFRAFVAASRAATFARMHPADRFQISFSEV